MITSMKLIPVTEKTYPFQSAARKCSFEKNGYIEEEYFMSGFSDIYTETGVGHQVRTLIAQAPYTTRLLVRRPERVEAFSGNVMLEILNSSAHIDIDRMWVNTWKYIVRNKDIYIGITSKGHVVDALKQFDALRYAEINWGNPDAARTPPRGGAFPFLEEYESGLYWDMQMDLAKLLREDNPLNPIRDYGGIYLYLAGWSQSATYVNRTLHSFSYLPENIKNGPLFDGYFMAGGDSSLAPINAYEIRRTDGGIFQAGTIPFKGMTMSKEPLIAINTESENRGANWGEDCDLPDCKFRSYQIAGSSHDSYYNLIDYYEGHLAEDVKRAGVTLEFEGAEGEALDAPYEYIFSAALRNLYLWVREGLPAPYGPRIEMVPAEKDDFDPFTNQLNYDKMKFENKKDIFGNTVGGIRMAALDYPVGMYKSYSIRRDGTYAPMFGTIHPFSPEKLKMLYEDIDHYRRLAEKNAEEIIAAGFLLREDKQDYVNQTVELAERRGL